MDSETQDNETQQNRELLRRGIQALKAGDSTTARRLLRDVSRRDPHNQTAWLWLSDATDHDAEKFRCYEHVVSIDPNSREGQIAWKKLRTLERVVPIYPQYADDPSFPRVGQTTLATLPAAAWVGIATSLLVTLLLIWTFADSIFNLSNRPITAQDVVQQLNSSGVQVGSISMPNEPPPSAIPTGYREWVTFEIPEIAPHGGQIFICSARRQCDGIYSSFVGQSPRLGPHTYRSADGRVVLHLHSSLPSDSASRFAAALQHVTSGQPVAQPAGPSVQPHAVATVQAAQPELTAPTNAAYPVPPPTTPPVPTSAPPTSTPTSAPPAPVLATQNMGSDILMQGARWRILAAEDHGGALTNDSDPSDDPTTSGRFIEVYLEVENQHSMPHFISPPRLEDASGNTFDPMTDVFEYTPPGEECTGAQILPDSEQTCTFFYDVPADARNLVVVVDNFTIADGEEARVRLDL
jgi:hypothetical protein